MKILLKNKKAYFDYTILDKYEAGVVLQGWEVKSIQFGMASITEGYVRILNGEAWLFNFQVQRWKTASSHKEIDTNRKKKLLLSKDQIKSIESKINQKNLTSVPLQVYLSNSRKVKIEIGLVKGKREYEKKQKLKEKDMTKQIQRDLKDMRL